MKHDHSIVMLCPAALVSQAQAFGRSLAEPVALGFEAELSGGWRGFETASRASTAQLAGASPSQLVGALQPDATDADGQPWTETSITTLLGAMVFSARGPDEAGGANHFDAVLSNAGLSRIESP